MALVAVVGAGTAAIASGQLPRAGERGAQMAQISVTLSVAPPSGVTVGSAVVLSANVQHVPIQIPGRSQRTLRYTFQAVGESEFSPSASSPVNGTASTWTWRPRPGSYRLQVSWDWFDPTPPPGRLLGQGRTVLYANNPYVVAAAPVPLTVTLRFNLGLPTEGPNEVQPTTRVGCLVKVSAIPSALPVAKYTFYARRQFGDNQTAASSTQDANVWNWTPGEVGLFTLGVQAYRTYNPVSPNPADNPSHETPFRVNPGPC